MQAMGSWGQGGFSVFSCFSMFLCLVFPLGPLVSWSPGPLVPWSPGPLVPWSPGPLVPWSPGPLVPWWVQSGCVLITLCPLVGSVWVCIDHALGSWAGPRGDPYGAWASWAGGPLGPTGPHRAQGTQGHTKRPKPHLSQRAQGAQGPPLNLIFFGLWELTLLGFGNSYSLSFGGGVPPPSSF